MRWARMLSQATRRAVVEALRGASRGWTPFPWQREPYDDDTSPTVLFTGSVYGGKSTLAARKIHRYCLERPGSFWLVARKTRDSCTDSVALALEEAVGDQAEHVPSASRFKYPNGSLIVYTGMSKPAERQKIRSIGRDGGVDGVWLEEATQFSELDYEEFSGRSGEPEARGR